MATASFISMIAAFNVDKIVNQDLYSYGLQLSRSWSIPYWDSMRTIFALAWLNIIVALAFQIYRIRTIRKFEEQSPNDQVEDGVEEKDVKKVNANACDKEPSEPTAIIDQNTVEETGEEVQIVLYNPQDSERIEAKTRETSEEQKETETADLGDVKTPQEETKPEESAETQVTVRWAIDKSNSKQNEK